MVQDILIEKGFNAQKTLFPVKPLSVMRGKYDWQYLRTGDTLQIHRSVEKGFAADELMEEGLIETKAADEMKKDESKHGKEVECCIKQRMAMPSHAHTIRKGIHIMAQHLLHMVTKTTILPTTPI